MSDLVSWPPTWSMLLLVPALFIGFTVHELGHALVAYLLGDTSQLERNRLSFNPVRHVSWSGMVVYLLMGFGWANPVWMDPARFRIRSRSFGVFVVGIAGPAANLLVALLVAMALLMTFFVVLMATGAAPSAVWSYFTEPPPVLDLQSVVVALSTYVLEVNLILALFNLLPVPPLDGFRALVALINTIYEGLRGTGLRSAGSRGAGSPGRTPRPASSRPLAAPAAAPLAPDDEDPAPSPARIHFEIGLDYQRQGQLDEAIARYRQALAHDESYDLAYYNLGLAYWAKGRLPLASSSFRAAMDASRDMGVRIQSDLRLREIAQAQADPDVRLRPAPAPLEPEAEPRVAVGDMPASLDAAAVRQVWLRLAAGGVLALVMGVSIWMFVTMAALMAFS